MEVYSKKDLVESLKQFEQYEQSKKWFRIYKRKY
jgi:hypothetical protein